MKTRPIGIVAGGGGPIGSSSVLQNIIAECQKQYGSCRSYEYPCINFYSFPYSEMLLVHGNSSSVPSRELSYCIQQLKLVGMEIIVIPCFTMSSYLTYRHYGVELIEMGTVMRMYLEKNNIKNPLVLCSDRTRKSGYCSENFACSYLNDSLQQEMNSLIETALKGEKVDVLPLLAKCPDIPIVCAMTTINAMLKCPVNDQRWINPNTILAEYVVQRSFRGKIDENQFFEMQKDASTISV